MELFPAKVTGARLLKMCKSICTKTARNETDNEKRRRQMPQVLSGK
jgi:hypothetical protein